MYVEIQWDKVIDIEYNIEGEGIYSISLMFDNGQAMTYGYFNQREFLKDCTEIAERRFK